MLLHYLFYRLNESNTVQNIFQQKVLVLLTYISYIMSYWSVLESPFLTNYDPKLGGVIILYSLSSGTSSLYYNY